MNQMTQNNKNFISTIYAPMQTLNFNLGTPKNCEKHQKPLCYYNKYKPEKDPICIDCLSEEAKDLNPPNLYLPFCNIEQDYFFQKKLLMQILEQSSNMKKYEKHIYNFQQLLIRYFSQFITRFIKEKIFNTLSKNQKGLEFLEKFNLISTSSSQDIMNVLNKFENEKFIVENKCADVFCQINKLQQLFLKNHQKLENNFKELLFDCFEEKLECNFDSNEKSNAKQNSFYYCKTQSNKKNPNLMNCVNIQNGNFPNSNTSAPSNFTKANKESLPNSTSGVKSLNSNNLNQFSPKEKIEQNIINEAETFSPKININMEKERIFEESPKSKKEQRMEETSEIIQNLNSREASSIKIDDLEMQKKKEEDNIVYRSHKEKINSLIEKDKNKKMNQSFYQPKRSNMKRRAKLNKSFQKFNRKFGHPKKFEYKQYNQFIQKTCQKCGASFPALENSGKDDNLCQSCRPSYNDDNDKPNRIMNKREPSYKREKNDFHKYGFRPKNYISQKKKFGPPSTTSRYWNKGKSNFIKPKKDLSFNSHHFGPKTLHHSNSNFISRHSNRMNSPKPFGRPKKFGGNNPINKYNSNGNKENYEIKKYNEKNLNDDFEVELNSVEESKNNESEEESEEKNEKSFNETSKNFFKNKSEDDKSNENENHFDYFDDDNNKNNEDDDFDEVKENENNKDDENNEDDDFDVDF